MPEKCKLESSWTEELFEAMQERWGIDMYKITSDSFLNEMKRKIDEEKRKITLTKKES